MPDFGPLLVFVLVALLAVMAGATRRAGRIWRDEATAGRIFKTMRSWWLWGDALLRGWVRALVAGLFLSLGVVASIILVNRPRFAVPPHARDEPGALAEWRTSRPRSRRPAQ